MNTTAALCRPHQRMYSAAMPRAALLLTMLLAACATSTRAKPNDEERRLLAFLARDHYVVIERTERDDQGYLVVITRQGSATRRYLIAPDDPAKPALRLRRLDDTSTLDTVPNPEPPGRPVRRGE